MSSAENEIYPTGFIIIVVIIAIKLSFSEGLLWSCEDDYLITSTEYHKQPCAWTCELPDNSCHSRKLFCNQYTFSVCVMSYHRKHIDLWLQLYLHMCSCVSANHSAGNSCRSKTPSYIEHIASNSLMLCHRNCTYVFGLWFHHLAWTVQVYSVATDCHKWSYVSASQLLGSSYCSMKYSYSAYSASEHQTSYHKKHT